MKLLHFVLLALSWATWQPVSAAAQCTGLWNHQFPRLQDDVQQSLCQYAGKVVLVVNTASFCGFTRQYEELEKLYARFRGRDFVILGFPSNDFGQQEPGSSQQIADLCFNTYGVKFPMFAKSTVSGSQANSLYRQLAERSGVTPSWNFHKYLVNRQGAVTSYSSAMSPLHPTLVNQIERLLAQR